MSDIMLAIMNRDYPILHTTKTGPTDYIDFIEQDDVFGPITKGYDIYGRPFLVIRAVIIRPDKDPIHVFQTFFKRYTDDSYWMGCGHGGTNFLCTDGGIRETQANFLNNLLLNGSVEITLQLMKEILFTGPTSCKIELI